MINTASVSSPMFKMENLSKNHTTSIPIDIETGAEVQKEVKHMFFDTIGVQFHFDTFLYQLVAHIFLPLFPCMVNMEGQVASTMYTWTTPLLAYVMLLSYGLCNGFETDGMTGACFVPLVYFLQHRLVIAMKYGSLSKTEYRKFMNCKDKELCINYRDQMQLGSAWMNLHSDVVHFELAAASARIGARINDIYLCIDNPNICPGALNQLRVWNAFLRGHDVIDFNSIPCQQLRQNCDGAYRLCVYDLCEGIAMKAMKADGIRAANTSYVITIFNLINLVIPLITICFFYNSNYSTWKVFWMVIFYISSSIINYVYAQTFYALLYIAIVDVYRQLSMMRDLNCMIRLTDIMLYAELSIARGVTEEDQSRVDLRVAEILSIQSNTSDHPATACATVAFEDPDYDISEIKSYTPVVTSNLTVSTCLLLFLYRITYTIHEKYRKILL